MMLDFIISMNKNIIYDCDIFVRSGYSRVFVNPNFSFRKEQRTMKLLTPCRNRIMYSLTVFRSKKPYARSTCMGYYIVDSLTVYALII